MKSYKISKLYGFIYIVPLVIGIAIFFYLQYSTITQSNKLVLDNFFNQVNRTIEIILNNEKRDIDNILNAHIEHFENKDEMLNLNNLDFIFFSKDNSVLKLQGFSLVVDIKKIANKLLSLSSLNNITTLNIDNKDYYLLVSRKKFINSTTGRVDGYIWGVVVLNENILLIDRIKSQTKIKDIVFLNDQNDIVVSSLNKNRLKNINYTISCDEISLDGSKNHILAKKTIFSKDQKLNSLIIVDSTKHHEIFDMFINRSVFIITFIFIVAIGFYIMIKYMLVDKLKDLKIYIEDRLKGDNNRYDSYIEELNTIAVDFDKFFIEYQNKNKEYENKLITLNQNLENDVKTKVVELIQKDAILQQQSKLAAMGEMIGAIAHQWRQPLNGISGTIINIEEAFEDGELTKEYLKDNINIIQKNLFFMSHTIDDFRNFFAPSKAKVDFYIHSAIVDAITLVKAQLVSRDIYLNVFIKNSFDSNITMVNYNSVGNLEEIEELKIFGYPNEFSQVIVNLVTNAKDAIIQHKDGGKIDIEIEPTKDSIIVSVKDDGGGIDNSIISRVFEPYFTTKDKQNGTGIGLYMSKMIIEDSMNGKLIVFNSLDGAVFQVILKRETDG